LPSGNAVDAILEVLPGDVPIYQARCEWDRWPLTEGEQAYYLLHIAPEVYEKLSAVVAPGGKVLVVQT
jgi:hypothetical protein